MARIVIAGASDTGREQLQRLLASSGYDVFRACASGGELRRALTTCEDGIVVMAGGLGDCSPDDLLDDFGAHFQILLIGRPDALSRCESPKLFKLATPCAGHAVLGAIEMLSQLHYMRMPHRVGDEKALVEQAKALLMSRFGIDEPEAHRRMQQYAMRHGVKMTEYAEQLLSGS